VLEEPQWPDLTIRSYLVHVAAIAALWAQWPFLTPVAYGRFADFYLPTPQFMAVALAEAWVGVGCIWWRCPTRPAGPWVLATIAYGTIAFVIVVLLVAVNDSSWR
jgi:hypothetical protein